MASQGPGAELVRGGKRARLDEVRLRNDGWFENPGNAHRWITLRFHGIETDRAGLGVRVKLVVTDARGASHHGTNGARGDAR